MGDDTRPSGPPPESAEPDRLRPFDRLARDLAAAYAAGDDEAVRDINRHYGTGFVHDRDPVKMQRRLASWFPSPARREDLALADARRMVAHAYGFDSWPEFAGRVVEGGAGGNSEEGRAAPGAGNTLPPFYTIDWTGPSISVRGPMSERDWDTLVGVMREHGIGSLTAGDVDDAAVERLTRWDGITRLRLDGSMRLTDAGLAALARLPLLQDLDIGGAKGVITDRGLAVLGHLPGLRRFQMCWQPNVSDAGVAHLAACDRLEDVNLMGTRTGDGAIAALAGKPMLRRLQTGRQVTDAGLGLLHGFPLFQTWGGGEVRYGLMSADAGPTHLMVDGPFTDAGLAGLAGLDGVFGLSFFWHSSEFTGAGLEPLRHLAHLGFLGCDGRRCDDEAMRRIAALPGLRMLVAQGAVAGDAGFAALSRSPTIEYIWGRECPNLTGAGFTALADMPALRGLAVSCRHVDDRALAALPRFAALRELMPMDVSDEGFRHVGRCARLEDLWCMYCRDTGDDATGHIAGLPGLRSYYAGQTRITDRSLEILARMPSLERVELWACADVTDAGVAALARLPRLRELTLDGLPGVTRAAAGRFAAHVRVSYSG